MTSGEFQYESQLTQPRGELVQLCDNYFEEVLTDPTKSGYTAGKDSTREYIFLVNNGDASSVSIFRMDVCDDMSQNYPYYAVDYVDGRDTDSGEPITVELTYPIDTSGTIHMLLNANDRLVIIEAPRPTANRLQRLIKHGTLADI